LIKLIALFNTNHMPVFC